MESLSSSSSSESDESSSDTEVLHDLCTKINYGLANAVNSTVGTESLSITGKFCRLCFGVLAFIERDESPRDIILVFFFRRCQCSNCE